MSEQEVKEEKKKNQVFPCARSAKSSERNYETLPQAPS